LSRLLYGLAVINIEAITGIKLDRG
jgi:hypothetical protein